MANKFTLQAGERTHYDFSTLYVVIDDTTGEVLTRPMGWNPSADYAAHRNTKREYPNGVTVVPAKTASAKAIRA